MWDTSKTIIAFLGKYNYINVLAAHTYTILKLSRSKLYFFAILFSFHVQKIKDKILVENSGQRG